jgi:hypothetical protein
MNHNIWICIGFSGKQKISSFLLSKDIKDLLARDSINLKNNSFMRNMR